MKHNLKRLFSLQNVIALGTIVFAAIFWFFTIDGIPNKVDNHEARISTLEHNNIELKTKLDMTLDSVMEIRALLLKSLLKEDRK